MAGPTPGQVLNGRYELRRRIGGGSMGEVWRGRDLVLGRTVAVKIVLPALLDTPTFRARFVAEARVMAMLDHPGIVGVFDYGYAEADDPDTPGAAFLVMEFIEGESLDKVLARTGPLEPRFALKVLASLLDALAAVHRAGVVHRDVKPANVMLTSGGVVLADFGIARSEESLGLTAADALMGTVPYLAPELFQAETPTPAADVYAVGILGYELLNGRQPFQAASTAAVMYKHMHEPPPPLPDYVATPAAEVLWRALEKDAARRWADGADMGAAMRRVLDGPVEVGEQFGAEPDYGRPHAGNRSGYEDTLADHGGQLRARGGRGVRRAGAGGAGASGFAGGVEEGAGLHGRGYGGQFGTGYAGGVEAAAGPHTRAYDERFEPSFGRSPYEERFDPSFGRSPYDEVFGDPLNHSDPLSDSGGRHGRAAALGEDAASDFGGRHGRAAASGPSGLSGPSGPSSHSAFEETARLEAETTRLAAFSDSGGRRGRPADVPVPDATRVFETESGGRHAASEAPPRRRAAEPGVAGTAVTAGTSPGRRGVSAGSRTDAARRRTLVTAAVAAPALLGLTVALVMNSSSDSSSKAPGSGPGPGAAQPVDQPTTYGTSDAYGAPYSTASTSSAPYYPRSTHHGSGAPATYGSGTQSATGTHTSTPNVPSSSAGDPSSTATSSSAPPTTPTSTVPSSPTSTTSSASTVPVPDVTGKPEAQARSTLTGQGFQVQVGSRSGGTGSTCSVSSQSPSGGSAPYGSTVTINLDCV
jgi:serine/threonine-protein kinase